MVRMNIAQNSDALAELQFHLAKVAQRSMTATAGAMKTGAGIVQERWKDFANGHPLKGVAEPLKHPTGGYARSIHTNKTDDFNYEIVSEAQIAGWIEDGTNDLDMNKTHPFGPRSRVSKKGYGYLIIPFRWGTPGKKVGFRNVMPINVYGIVSKFKKMKTEVSADSPAAVKTPNAQTPNKMVGRAKYNKRYGRLKGNEYGNMNGMVRSTDITGKNRSGGYFTFRIISADPDAKKWKIRQGLPARHVTKAVAEETQPAIDAIVESAIVEDLGL